MIQYHSINSIEFYMNLFDITMTENKVDIFFKKSNDQKFLKEQNLYANKAGHDYEFYQYLYNITYQINHYKQKYKNLLNTFIYLFLSIFYVFWIKKCYLFIFIFAFQTL